MSHISAEQFENYMARSLRGALGGVSALAVGVSGGPDSVALLFLLHRWCDARGIALHVLSVDHGMRAAAADECAGVARFCDLLGGVAHHTLVWDAPKDVRVQEEARRARYDLMRGYCVAHHIQHLFLGHHQEDQAETVLFRLAKGSGLAGLCGMRPVQAFWDIDLCRPLLGVSKSDLLAVCDGEGLSYFSDPSNVDDGFARVRLRQSMDILAAEGLSAKRLAVTAARLGRVNNIIDELSNKSFENNALIIDTKRIEFNLKILKEYDEVFIRVLLKAIYMLGDERDYAPRMEKVEALADAFKYDEVFRKRTLGGVIFERDDAGERIILSCEK